MPDGRRVLVKLLPEGSPVFVPTDTIKYGNDSEPPGGAEGAQVRVFTSPDTSSGLREGPSARLAYRADLALIDLQSGAATRLARNVVPFGYWLSPDGRFVAFLDRRGWVPDSQQPVFALEIAATSGVPNRRVLVEDVRQQYGISVSWAPDGRRLAYTTFSQLADGKCYVVSLHGERQSFGDASQPLGAAYAPPLWSPDSREVYLFAGRAVHRLTPETGELEKLGASEADLTVLAVAPVAGSEHLAYPAGGSIIVAVTDRATGEQGLAEVTAKGELKRRHMALQSLGLRPQFNIARNVSVVVAATETTDSPQQLSSIALVTGDRRTFARLNPDLHDRQWGRSTFIDWRVPSGATIRGAVLLPPGFARGQDRPGVVLVYGGSRQSEQAFVFDPKLQMWLTRGYVVFLPDMPMGRGQPVRDIVETVNAGVDRLIADGYVHPKRIGVWGWSYGGYSTLALLTRSDRFRAGVAGAGFGNLFSQYGTLSSGGSDSVGYLERGQGALKTHPWNDRERYIENSPFFFLDRISGPVLIVHGAQDTAVPVHMSHEVFVGLRRLGKKAELVVYLDEDHTIERRHNTEDYWNRMIQWFGEHLQVPPPSEAPSH
jgi:dipeptidyl aminopeptidase/acylaminoacyl peptidase